LQVFPSIDDSTPSEEGGPIARSGFNYQDEIAVGFLIEMLENLSLLKVHCETHDDILLVRTKNGSAARLAEFVQVKANEPDKLWSIADLCALKGKGKIGTSILEISFAKDQYHEESRFRLVTLRPVVSDLNILTLPCGAPGREADGDGCKTLCAELDQRFPNLKSAKGNSTSYWVENCVWDVRHSDDEVRKDNLLRLVRLSGREGRQLLVELAETLLQELRVWAKAAAAAKWIPNKDKKIITREVLRTWWERRTGELIEGAAAPSGGKLREKLTEAGLPNEIIGLAIEMRRQYAATVRASRYAEDESGKRLQDRVRSELISLRSRLVAGQLTLDGRSFHDFCLSRMDAVSAEHGSGEGDRSAFLKGCMYDIADRCLMRFAEPTR